jgi:SAM-dependent methyltransferase
MGRYTRFTASYVEALVALDGSDAVEAAARNLADTPNTLVIKADLRDPPLGPRTFGFVSCLGVLHRLSDPLEGFRALTNLLEDGGLLLIYPYSRPAKMDVRAAGLAAAQMLRRLSRRIPFRWLRALSAPIAAVLYGFVVWPGTLGDLLGIHALSGPFGCVPKATSAFALVRYI